MVGILYDNISGNTGDQAIGISVKRMLRKLGIDFEELVIGRFNPNDYDSIVIGGGALLRPSPDWLYDKFRVPGHNILNCCGTFGTLNHLDYLNDYLYISVRSDSDKQKLAALKKEVKVVPCTTMLLEDVPGLDLPIKRPSLGIHLARGLLDDTALVDFLSKQPFHIYLLPVTHYNHDFNYLATIHYRLPNSTLLPILTPEEIFTVIGRFDYFVTCSLHGAYFAYVHQVPFLVYSFPNSMVEKTRSFMQERGLGAFLFGNVQELESSLASAQNNRLDYSPLLERDFKTLYEHQNTIKELLQRYITLTRSTRTQPTDQDDRLQQQRFQIHFLMQQTQMQTQQLSQLQQHLQLKEQQLSQLQQHLQLKDQQLSQLQQNTTVQLVLQCQKTADRLLPVGSWRRRCYDFVMHRLKSTVITLLKCFSEEKVNAESSLVRTTARPEDTGKE